MAQLINFRTTRLPALLAFATLLAGCGTVEYQATRNACAAEWQSKIPPRFEQEFYNRRESRQVPSGRTTCTGFGNFIQCTESMRTEYYTVPAVRTVDRNQARRDAQIRMCTQSNCVRQYGNAECIVQG